MSWVEIILTLLLCAAIAFAFYIVEDVSIALDDEPMDYCGWVDLPDDFYTFTEEEMAATIAWRKVNDELARGSEAAGEINAGGDSGTNARCLGDRRTRHGRGL